LFTGIIRDIGEIVNLDQNNSDLNISVKTNLSLEDVKKGDSICCDGICLTAISLGKKIFNAELSEETLSITTSKLWKKGKNINIEKSLLLGEQIGGHLVTGHVDCLGILKKKMTIKGSTKLDFKIPKSLQKYVSKKGSIAINGISLTVNSVNQNIFSVNIISHTMKNTTLGILNINDKVNIEVDTIARYAVNAAKYYIKEK
jgi:riboflavin synthase